MLSVILYANKVALTANGKGVTMTTIVIEIVGEEATKNG